MGALLTASALAEPDVGAIYRWLAAARRSPSLGQRAQTVYTGIVVAGIFGVLLYGTASSALAAVISPVSVARWGPSLVLLALLGAGHWGTVQGPVVFSPADLAHLFGAPVSRAALVARPLRRAFVLGACAGVLVAGVLVVGLTGDGRSVAVARVVGLVAGLGLSGVLCVASAFLVSIDSRAERALRVATWPVVAVAGALVVCAFAGGDAGRTVALWSGPWGWAIQAGAAIVSAAEWIGGLVAVAVAGGPGCGDGVAPPRHRRDRTIRAPGRGSHRPAGVADGPQRADRPAQSGRGGFAVRARAPRPRYGLVAPRGRFTGCRSPPCPRGGGRVA
jgi:hypothetical protein